MKNNHSAQTKDSSGMSQKKTVIPKKYSIKTFGCKVNTYDSALIQKNLNHAGLRGQDHKSFQHDGGVHIVNTCAVTEEAVKSAQSYIRGYRKKHPQDRIVVTGCSAQVETEKFSTLKEVDLVVANSHKMELADIIMNTFGEEDFQTDNPVGKVNLQSDITLNLEAPDFQTNNPIGKVNSQVDNDFSFKDSHSSLKHKKLSQARKVFKSSIFKKNDLGKDGGVESGHTRLFLKIQDGCSSFCSFCIIPFARGKSRSLAPQDLVRSVQKHYEQGVREVVLTGVHIGDYRFPDDNKKGLAELVHILLRETNMPRIRLSSLEPPELSDELLDIFTDSRICSHFHLSIQSAHSEVLTKMKRRYSAEEVESVLLKIHKKIPKAFVGMDLIAGFAEETQEQFEETYSRLKNWPWTKIHVFPYSPRRYTYAEKAYASWPRSLIMKRAGFLRRLSEDRLNKEKRKQIGTVKAILPLKHKNHFGLSRDYWTVLLPKKESAKESVKESAKEFAEYPEINNSGELLLRIHSINPQNQILVC